MTAFLTLVSPDTIRHNITTDDEMIREVETDLHATPRERLLAARLSACLDEAQDAVAVAEGDAEAAQKEADERKEEIKALRDFIGRLVEEVDALEEDLPDGSGWGPSPLTDLVSDWVNDRVNPHNYG
ncbi:MAG: hypothetical protein ACXIUZ_02115 [Lysobacteraceae bacterium]